MPIKVKITTPTQSITQYVEQQMDEMRRQAIVLLMRIGEECVNKAKEAGKYTDRTGNLRSSIGYMVVDNGQIVDVNGFGQGASQTLPGADGKAEGQSYIENLASTFNKGLTLVLVAGMKYAYYVNDRGYDVLDSAEILAERLVEQLFE